MCVETWRGDWTVATAHSLSASQDIVFSVREVSLHFYQFTLSRRQTNSLIKEGRATHIIQLCNLPQVLIVQEKLMRSKLKPCMHLSALFDPQEVM